MKKYKDRKQAGKVLADMLKEYADSPDVLILGLPRGGVPVAFEVAQALNLPLDVFVVRKLGVPWYKELAMGAVASGGTIVLNEEMIKSLNISPSEIEGVIQKEEQELHRREQKYRHGKSSRELKGKTLILVDDGIATGYTVKAAVQALRKHHPGHIVMAAPVAALSACKELSGWVDAIICPLKPTHFQAVGSWYECFNQTEDAEVQACLSRSF